MMGRRVGVVQRGKLLQIGLNLDVFTRPVNENVADRRCGYKDSRCRRENRRWNSDGALQRRHGKRDRRFRTRHAGDRFHPIEEDRVSEPPGWRTRFGPCIGSQPNKMRQGSRAVKFTSAEISRKYDGFARWYDWVEGVPDLLGVRRLRRKLLESASGRVLEVAVGTGKNFPIILLGAELPPWMSAARC